MRSHLQSNGRNWVPLMFTCQLSNSVIAYYGKLWNVARICSCKVQFLNCPLGTCWLGIARLESIKGVASLKCWSTSRYSWLLCIGEWLLSMTSCIQPFLDLNIVTSSELDCLWNCCQEFQRVLKHSIYAKVNILLTCNQDLRLDRQFCPFTEALLQKLHQHLLYQQDSS